MTAAPWEHRERDRFDDVSCAVRHGDRTEHPGDGGERHSVTGGHGYGKLRRVGFLLAAKSTKCVTPDSPD